MFEEWGGTTRAQLFWDGKKERPNKICDVTCGRQVQHLSAKCQGNLPPAAQETARIVYVSLLMEGAWEESSTGFCTPTTLTFISHGTGLLSDSGYTGQGQILWRLRSHI